MISLKDNLKKDDEQLKQSFKEAKQNKNFTNFLEKLKIDDELAINYTSTLNDCMEEYEHCLDCQGLAECKNKILGYMYFPKMSNSLQFIYKECRYKKKQAAKYQYLKNVKYYNLPEALKEASFSNIDKRLSSRKEVIAWLYEFINNPTGKGIYLHGNFGCGKTYLIVATFNELAKKNVKSAVIFWPEFLRNLKSTFDTDFEDRINYLKTIPILLIDDLGAESLTTWARDEILCSILQYRMDEKLTTFITSNLDMQALEQHLSTTKDGVEQIKSRRIIERIKQLTIDMEMISKNMRN